MVRRSSGVLLHPTSLSNPYPIGDLGPSAIAFATFFSESGQSWWQMLPIGPTGGGNSPYQSSSAFAGNPYLISPDWLVERGLLERVEVEPPVVVNPQKADYGLAQSLKDAWLRKAFTRFEYTPQITWTRSFDDFAKQEAFWLEDFALFTAIQAKLGTQDWTRWDEGLRDRRPEALQETQRPSRSRSATINSSNGFSRNSGRNCGTIAPSKGSASSATSPCSWRTIAPTPGPTGKFSR